MTDVLSDEDLERRPVGGKGKVDHLTMLSDGLVQQASPGHGFKPIQPAPVAKITDYLDKLRVAGKSQETGVEVGVELNEADHVLILCGPSHLFRGRPQPLQCFSDLGIGGRVGDVSHGGNLE